MNEKSNKPRSIGPQKDKYDVVIVGAGIGGLVCGCYLAKAGLSVLMVEQHSKPGGYCTSFKRKGYTFDATTHYIGSFRENGILRNIYDDLELCSKIEIIRFDPSDVVICPDYKIHIRSDFNKTIIELQETFKQEAGNIAAFFKFINNSDLLTLYAKLRRKTFRELLDEYFIDHHIKSVLGVFLGNIGVPPSRASALSSVILFKEFVMDGGYYPRGGMQKFSDAFADRFKELGGEIIFSKKVEKIVVEDQSVKGAVIGNDIFVKSNIVVSNGDASHTFCRLIGKEHLPADFVNKMNNLEISPSAFIVYLGINKNYSQILKDRCSWWCYLNRDFDAEKLFSDLDRKDRPYSDDFIFCVFPSSHDNSLAPADSEVMYIVIPAKMSNSFNWNEKKYDLAEVLTKKAEKFIIGLSEFVSVREIATPLTMRNYTLNTSGASYGWSSTVPQIDMSIMPSEGYIKGLYLAGHWTTQGTGQGGISTVSLSGKRSAENIIKHFTGKDYSLNQ